MERWNGKEVRLKRMERRVKGYTEAREHGGEGWERRGKELDKNKGDSCV